MRSFLMAIRVFFRVLFDAELRQRIEPLLEGRATFGGEASAKKQSQSARSQPARTQPAQAQPTRSDALALLAALQREARFVDFVKEPIDAYSDEQVGAAVREVHRQCAQVLERMFGLQPVVSGEEGTEMDVPPEFDASRLRLTGRVAENPPYHGRLVHHGWEATVSELPRFSGGEGAARIVAPAEVEIQ